MDHSSAVYLMDKRGRFADVVSYQEQPARAVGQLRTLLRD